MHRKATTKLEEMTNRREKNKPLNTLNKQLETVETRVKERNDNLIQLGKFFYSLAGMTYAGIILTSIINLKEEDENDGKIIIICLGVVATVILATIAWRLVKSGNIKR